MGVPAPARTLPDPRPFERHFTTPTGGPYDGITWTTRDAVVLNKDGSVRQKIEGVVVPDFWSQNATNILATKYLRRAGVPDKTERHDTPPALAATAHAKSLPDWLRPSRPAPDAAFGRETDARQAFHRLAGMWTYHAWLEGYFDAGDLLAAKQEAAAFYDEVCYLLAHQMMAPNTPQWLGGGLWWAYGITGSNRGGYKVPGTFPRGQTATPDDAVPLPDSYQHPLLPACYLLSVDDNLAGDNGIMDLWQRESRVFAFGGGVGVNVSALRGEDEPISGGGRSSGTISWLGIGDRAAGSIKSGGVARRAALMRQMDDNHPDIEKFVDWKVIEEGKVAALVAGSVVANRHAKEIHAAVRAGGHRPRTNKALRTALTRARASGVPNPYIRKVVACARSNMPVPPLPEMDCDWQGEAYQTVSGQNANNTVRCTDAFMRAVEADGPHRLYARTELRAAAAEGRDPKPLRIIPARALWVRICRAAWSVACPGTNYHDTINDFNLAPNDGDILTSNPCSEYHALNDTACNLASLNLVSYYDPEHGFRVDDYLHAVAVTHAILDVTTAISGSPSKALAAGLHNYRNVGQGYANLGALLMRQGVPYDSEEGRQLAAAYTFLMHGQALRTSAWLADRRGPSPRYAANRAACEHVVGNHARLAQGLPAVGMSKEYQAIRRELLPRYLSEDVSTLAAAMEEDTLTYGLCNHHHTCIAPTGTIALVMDCDTTGLEPDYALVKYKQLAGGGGMTIVNQSVLPALRELGYDPEACDRIVRHVEAAGTVEGSPDLKPEHLPVFDCAMPSGNGVRYIAPMGHVAMLAATQPHLGGSSSKTINMPSECTVEQVAEIYMTSWKLGIKAVALYRAESKLNEPLTSGVSAYSELLEEFPDEDAPPAPVVAKPKRRRLPNRRPGYTQKVRVGSHKLYLRTGEYPDGTLGEIFIDMHKEGAAFRALMNSFAVAVSLGLQHGVPLEEYIDAYVGTKFEPNGPVQGSDRIRMSSSLLDYIFRQLAVDYLGRQELANVTLQELSPPAPSDAARVPAASHPTPPVEADKVGPRYSGEACGNCGNFTLLVTGTCKTCLACGSSTGCV